MKRINIVGIIGGTIEKRRRLHNHLTRAFFSSIVRCRLVPRKERIG
jgi:hypothetical protein